MIFIFLDYLTGVLVALLEKNVNSTIGRRGIFNKVGTMICVVLCKLIDTLQIAGFAPILPILALFFLMNEGFSILENLSGLNVPIPYALVSMLKKKKKMINRY